MNDMISLITIYLGLPLMSNSSHQDARRRRDTLAMVNLEGVPEISNIVSLQIYDSCSISDKISYQLDT